MSDDDYIWARPTDPATSHAADEVMHWRSNGQRVQILTAYLVEPRGLTDDEAQERAHVAPESCYWKRCSELRAAGLITWTGETRIGRAGMPRMVCQITQQGRIAHRRLADN